MRTPNILFVLAAVILAFAASSVRSEYTWNGSEWVWSENKNPQPPEVYEPEEGSGGGDSNYYEEDDDDTMSEYGDYGSGDDDIVDPYNSPNNNNIDYNNNKDRGNQQPRNNYPTYGDPYDDLNRGQDNSQINPPSTASPPWGGLEEEEEEGGIYMEGPPLSTITTMVDPQQPELDSSENMPGGQGPKNTPSRSTSFFAQPGTLAAVIGGAVVGLLCAILCVMFVVYRMRKKDEGSYALDEPKRSPTVNAYAKHPSREFYA